MSSSGKNDRDDRVKDIMNFCFGKVSCDRKDKIFIGGEYLIRADETCNRKAA